MLQRRPRHGERISGSGAVAWRTPLPENGLKNEGRRCPTGPRLSTHDTTAEVGKHCPEAGDQRRLKRSRWKRRMRDDVCLWPSLGATMHCSTRSYNIEYRFRSPAKRAPSRRLVVDTQHRVHTVGQASSDHRRCFSQPSLFSLLSPTAALARPPGPARCRPRCCAGETGATPGTRDSPAAASWATRARSAAAAVAVAAERGR